LELWSLSQCLFTVALLIVPQDELHYIAFQYSTPENQKADFAPRRQDNYERSSGAAKCHKRSGHGQRKGSEFIPVGTTTTLVKEATTKPGNMELQSRDQAVLQDHSCDLSSRWSDIFAEERCRELSSHAETERWKHSVRVSTNSIRIGPEMYRAGRSDVN